MRRILTLASAALLALGTAACGSDGAETAATTAAATTAPAVVTTVVTTADSTSATSAVLTTTVAAEKPSIVVTTNILGDVVTQIVGDLAAVEVIMPLGADPHDFAPSAKQAESIEKADLVVVNGAGFEAGMTDLLEIVGKGGTATFAFSDNVELLEAGAGEHDHGHEEEKEGEKEGEEEGGLDPHLWTDPARMVKGVTALKDALAKVAGIDAAAVSKNADAYIAKLTELDTEIEKLVAPLPDASRVLVTNHEVFGYFADRYKFEVVGAVVPSLTTAAETTPKELQELAKTMKDEGIRTIFAETTQSTDLAAALAKEVGGDVKVIELFSESLGEKGSGAETYIDMMRANAKLIATALSAA